MRCEFIKPNGEQCGADAMKDSQLCFTHNPAMKEAKKEAVILGGKSPKKNYNPQEVIRIRDHKDVVRLISRTINEVRQGTIDVRVANCVFYGSGQLLKALEVADLGARVAKLEEILKQQKYAS